MLTNCHCATLIIWPVDHSDILANYTGRQKRDASASKIGTPDVWYVLQRHHRPQRPATYVHALVVQQRFSDTARSPRS